MIACNKLPWHRLPCLMGIVNTTPDSFSDGGAYLKTAAALKRVQTLLEDGAAIIDIGGESTRPGSQRVPPEVQKERVLPVVEASLAVMQDVFISVDTTSSIVAEAALDKGAKMLNDVSAAREDPMMLALAAERQTPICLMHMQGEPASMQNDPHYDNVVEEVYAFLSERVEAAVHAGVNPTHLVVDPGIGFGKTLQHNLLLLARLARFVQIGCPVLLGASRKRFIAEIEGGKSPGQRLAGSCVAAAVGFKAGVKIFRVHDVAEHRQALAVMQAVDQAALL